MSPCSIARALPGLQQVNAADPSPLTSPIHLQTERSGCGTSPVPNPAGLVGVASEKPAPSCVLQDCVSGNLQLSLCFWAKFTFQRVTHAPGPKHSKSSEGEGCLLQRSQGLSNYAALVASLVVSSRRKQRLTQTPEGMDFAHRFLTRPSCPGYFKMFLQQLPLVSRLGGGCGVSPCLVTSQGNQSF